MGSTEVEENLPAEIRQQRTHEYLNERGFVRVRELSDRFGVSTVTARNDLDALAQRRSGAARPRRSDAGQPITRRAVVRGGVDQRADEKLRIAQAAAELVSTGESILVDVGTTAAAFAARLVARPDLGELNVITNGISIALALEAAHPRFSIVVTGGTLRPKQHSLVDPLAGSFLKTLSVDTVFLGCNGIHPSAGISNINLPEANVKRAMIEASQRCVVMADSSKIGTRTLASVCSIDDVDVVVTDGDVRGADVDWLKERGVDVIVA